MMETIFLLTAALIIVVALDFGEASARARRRTAARRYLAWPHVAR